MYQIPSLPYEYSDLEPYIDEATMKVHHLKHHQAYTDKLNAALEKYPELKDADLSTLIYEADTALPEDIRTTVINNGGGYLNHSFFWPLLRRPESETNEPTGTAIGKALNAEFENYEGFKKQFSEKALGLFGSGWTWLLVDKTGKLKIENTANQLLAPRGSRAVLALDL